MTTFPSTPTGRVLSTGGGAQLVIERTFRASIEDVWASLTEPDRLARWYGTFVGEAGPGGTVMVTMTAEEDAPAEPARILACDPPNLLVVEVGVQDPPWHLSVGLVETGGATTMTLVQTLTADVDVTDVGPGWEFYADRLTAALQGRDMPDWDADGYLEALSPHYAHESHR
jgi:uncharacterized protein YndB with AHSA1/START domain